MRSVILAPSARIINGASLLTVAPPNPHDPPNQENANEYLEVEVQDADKDSIIVPMSPTDFPSVPAHDGRRGKWKYVWDRVRRMAVRSSLSFGRMS